MEMLISVRSAFCHESENGVCYLVMEYLDVGIIDSTFFFFRAKRRSTRKRGQRLSELNCQFVIAKKIKHLPETIFGVVAKNRPAWPQTG